mgnify:CR=1 FL=1
MINQMAYYTKKKNRGWNGCENYSDKDRKLVVHVQTEQKGMMMLPSPAYHRGVGRVRTSESLADPREGRGGGACCCTPEGNASTVLQTTAFAAATPATDTRHLCYQHPTNKTFLPAKLE